MCKKRMSYRKRRDWKRLEHQVARVQKQIRLNYYLQGLRVLDLQKGGDDEEN